jgi:uncharacterized protein
MQTYLKRRPAGIQFLMFFFFSLGLFLVLSDISMVLLQGATGVKATDLLNQNAWTKNKEGISAFMRGAILMQFLGLFLIPSLLFARLSDPKPFDYLGLRKPFHASYWVMGIALLLVAIPVVDVLGFLNQKMEFGGSLFRWMKEREEEAAAQVQFLAARHTVKELLLNLFFIAVLAGVGEELFFRGVLQRLFIRITKSPWAGIIIAAFLFSAFHLQFFGFFPRFVLGILLGAMYWYSGSLWVSILAHFFYDALIIVIIYANPEMAKDPNAMLIKTSLLAIPAIISALLVVLILRRMKSLSKASFEETYRNDFEIPDYQKPSSAI